MAVFTPKIQNLMLKGIKVGIDNIPEQVWNNIPGGYYKAQEQNKAKKSQLEQDYPSERSRRRYSSAQRRGRSPSYSDDEYYYSDYDTPRNRRRGNHRRRRSPVPTQDIVQDKTITTTETQDTQPGDNMSTYPYKAYNPADYAGSTPNGATTKFYPSEGYSEPSNPYDAYSSAADARYRPSSYAPQGNTYAVQPYTAPAYSPSMDNDYSSRSYRSSSRGSRNSRSRSTDRYRKRGGRSKSRGREGKSQTRTRSRSVARIKEKMTNLGDKERDMFAGGAGALAGGFLGRELGHNKVSALVGAALGGIAAHAWEKKQDQKRAKSQGGQRQLERGYSPARQSNYRGRDRDNKSRNRGYDSGDDYSDSDSEYYARRSSRGDRYDDKKYQEYRRQRPQGVRRYSRRDDGYESY